MNKSQTDTSSNLVTLDLRELQETAKIAVGSLANQSIKYAEAIREELNKTLYKKEDRDENFRVSTSLNAEWLERAVKGLVIATRTMDALYAADDRDEIIVLK